MALSPIGRLAGSQQKPNASFPPKAQTPPQPSPSKSDSSSFGKLFMLASIVAGGSVVAYTYSPDFRDFSNKCPVPQVTATLRAASVILESGIKQLNGFKLQETQKSQPIVEKKAIPPVDTPRDAKTSDTKMSPSPMDIKKDEPALRVPTPVLSEKVPPPVVTGKKVETISNQPPFQAPPQKATAVKEELETATPESKKSAIDLIEQKGKDLRLETMERTSEALVSEATALRRELEGSLLRDLDALDIEGLRYRIIQLAAELQERTKWEALRLHESLKQAQEETSRRYNDLLRQQKDAFNEKLEREIRKTEDRSSDAAMAQMKIEISQLQKEQQEKETQFVAEKTIQLEEEFDKKYQAESARLINDYNQKVEKSIQQMLRLKDEVLAIERVLSDTSSYFKNTQRVHLLSALTLALSKKLETSEPIYFEVALIRKAASSDPLLSAVLNSLPEDKFKGIPTAEQLKLRFQTVKAAARSAALIPEGSDGAMGQLLGTLLSFVTFSPKGYIDGSGAEEVLARTEYLLELGELGKAVSQIENLKGKASLVVKDWQADAKSRLKAEQALQVMLVQASLLNDQLI